MSNAQNPQPPAVRQLPTIEEIHSDNPDAYKMDRFKSLVNKEPPPSWVKKHPLSGNAYIPVEKTEYLLDAIIGQWMVEIKNVFALFNSVTVIIRLHYLNPVTLEWAYHDGAGAAPVQTDKGMSAADLGAIKSNAIQLAAPAAVSYALKDAAEHIGILFGRNISRKDSIGYKPTFSEDPYSGQQPTIVDPPPQPPAGTATQPVTQPVAPVAPPPPPPPPVVIDTAPPKFEADFFAPIEGDDEKPYPPIENQEIDF